MPFATCNGIAISRAEIVEPLRGVWVADVELDSMDVLSGSAVLLLGDVEWRGTVQPGRSAVDGGRAKARLIGGNDGLRKPIPSRYYLGPTLGVVVASVLMECNETLSPTAGDLASWIVARWQRTSGSAGKALEAVCSAAEYSWRVLRDGTVWVGFETWPDLEGKQTEVGAYSFSAAKAYSPEYSPLVAPGMSVGGQHVSSVMTLLSASSLRQEVWFDD